jgi:ribose-phosphate pyrophosphokinase
MKKVILLSDPKSNAWNFAKEIKEYLYQERKFAVPLEPLRINHFPNNELDMEVPTNLREKDVYFIHDSTKNPQEWWAELLSLSNLLHLASVNNINYVLPDMKYSRQDRKPKSRVPITANALAFSLTKYPKIKKIFTMDLHSLQIQGFYAPLIALETLPSSPSLVTYLKEKSGISDLEDIVLVAADKGDVERTEDLCTRLKLKNPPANIYKQRELDGSRRIKKMELIGNVKGKKVLIPDDIIDSGKTICNAGELLLENGATELNCYATHGWFSNGANSVLDCFNRVIVSNTHNKDYGDKIKVIDVSRVFAEAIYRAQEGISISELFE